jgi:hypothetical protein
MIYYRYCSNSGWWVLVLAFSILAIAAFELPASLNLGDKFLI